MVAMWDNFYFQCLTKRDCEKKQLSQRHWFTCALDKGGKCEGRLCGWCLWLHVNVLFQEVHDCADGVCGYMWILFQEVHDRVDGVCGYMWTYCFRKSASLGSCWGRLASSRRMKRTRRRWAESVHDCYPTTTTLLHTPLPPRSPLLVNWA